MTKKKRLAKSIRKFVRKEKARIRREVLDPKKQKELIDQLCKKYDHQRHLRVSN